MRGYTMDMDINIWKAYEELKETATYDELDKLIDEYESTSVT